jgi:hypothetical protein
MTEETTQQTELTSEQAEALWESQCETAAGIFIRGMQEELKLPLALTKRWGGKVLDRLVELDLDATNPDDYFKAYVDLQASGYFDDLQAEIEAEEAAVNELAPQSISERAAARGAIRIESNRTVVIRNAVTEENLSAHDEEITRLRNLPLAELKREAIADRRSRIDPQSLRAQDAGLRS